MKINIILVSFGLVIFSSLISLHSSCEKDKNDNKETICGTTDPLEELDWLKNIVSELEDGPLTEIYLYDYKEEKVFLINKCVNCPDGLVEVYNCDSNVICIFGGFTGMNTCPDFDSLAVKDLLLWKNY